VSINHWLYVSKSTISIEKSVTEIENIVRDAHVKNAMLGVTGALVFGGGHFCQVIEGPPAALLMLRSDIMTDHRHTAIKTLADGKIDRRRFEGWSLAYSGASMVVSRAIQRSLRDFAQGSDNAGIELLQLIDELVTPL
jgi:hypothetical protein